MAEREGRGQVRNGAVARWSAILDAVVGLPDSRQRSAPPIGAGRAVRELA
jgi:hypothetical protein